MRYAGIVVGLLIAGGLGGLALASIADTTAAVFGVLLGIGLSYPIVRWAMRFDGARPALRWLYPYEAWTGSN